MDKHEFITTLENTEGVFSIMDFHLFDGDLFKFLEDKKMSRVFEKSKVMLEGDVIWVEVLYKTKQSFYLHLENKTIGSPRWGLRIYYKPEQLNELVIFIKQVLKQFRDATINN